MDSTTLVGRVTLPLVPTIVTAIGDFFCLAAHTARRQMKIAARKILFIARFDEANTYGYFLQYLSLVSEPHCLNHVIDASAVLLSAVRLASQSCAPTRSSGEDSLSNGRLWGQKRCQFLVTLLHTWGDSGAGIKKLARREVTLTAWANEYYNEKIRAISRLDRVDYERSFNLDFRFASSMRNGDGNKCVDNSFVIFYQEISSN